MQRVVTFTALAAAFAGLVALMFIVGSDTAAMHAHDEWMHHQQAVGAWVVE